jgi:HSP20 family protein
MGWPSLEVSESDKDYTVTAQLPGLEEKNVQLEFVDGVPVMKDEKKTEEPKTKTSL